MATRIHPETGKLLHRAERPMKVGVGPFTEEVVVGGWYPEGDGDAIHSGADLAKFEEPRQRLASRYAERSRD